jgi:hypothetical protein
MGCIFCRSDKNLTNEHVFPAFMGGRLEARRASCDKCNRIFGVAEAAIKDATTPLLNLLRIKNRYGKVPNAPLRAGCPTFRRLVRGSWGARVPDFNLAMKKRKKAGWSIRPFQSTFSIGCGGQI